MNSSYQPKGRTDESSYDYTDDPRQLAMKFSAAELREEIAFAEENGSDSAMLKFDYEEYVPLQAVREAAEIARRQDRW